MKIVATDRLQLEEEDVQRLKKLGEAEIFKDVVSGQQLIDRLKLANIALVGCCKISAEILNHLHHLQVISVATTGYDNIDIQAAHSKNILVTNVPSYAGVSVAELVFGLVLALIRKIPQAIESTKAGIWNRMGLQGIELSGRVLGIIGVGSIGKSIIPIAQGFGMKVVATTANPSKIEALQLGIEFLELEDTLKISDIVVICLPLTPTTYQLIGEKQLRLMKQSAILVNVSRGEIIDETSLLNALEIENIRGACLDVVGGELNERLIKLVQQGKILATPHIGFYTQEAQRLRIDIAIRNIERFLVGQPENIIHPTHV